MIAADTKQNQKIRKVDDSKSLFMDLCLQSGNLFLQNQGNYRGQIGQNKLSFFVFLDKIKCHFSKITNC
ncbi:hypothetical protein SUBVAR_05649 [Subdoligranulum variabile DSM 15176]|uniref:Uncharacterized protein n=1 Tax=Subdoligranulum variabile DSM 15176 TaxID=411471 RepID=D1PMT5_9FIRM|nr:hypothetical protein SUBVAR_05649 [Subdoligranulum variabile DSM 15176]